MGTEKNVTPNNWGKKGENELGIILTSHHITKKKVVPEKAIGVLQNRHNSRG